jgi:hypothetical protein
VLPHRLYSSEHRAGKHIVGPFLRDHSEVQVEVVVDNHSLDLDCLFD